MNQVQETTFFSGVYCLLNFLQMDFGTRMYSTFEVMQWQRLITTRQIIVDCPQAHLDTRKHWLLCRRWWWWRWWYRWKKWRWNQWISIWKQHTFWNVQEGLDTFYLFTNISLVAILALYLCQHLTNRRKQLFVFFSWGILFLKFVSWVEYKSILCFYLVLTFFVGI